METVTLGIATRYIPLIKRGKKTTTLRAGKRSYKLGPACFSDEETIIQINITKIEYLKCTDLTEDIAVSDGFSSLLELTKALEHHYPGLKLDDDLTLVTFEVS